MNINDFIRAVEHADGLNYHVLLGLRPRFGGGVRPIFGLSRRESEG